MKREPHLLPYTFEPQYITPNYKPSFTEIICDSLPLQLARPRALLFGRGLGCEETHMLSEHLYFK